jgi:hypothetical protein
MLLMTTHGFDRVGSSNQVNKEIFENAGHDQLRKYTTRY